MVFLDRQEKHFEHKIITMLLDFRFTFSRNNFITFCGHQTLV